MIYLDYAATTPVDSEVLEAMLPYFKENFGNPLSQHAAGRAAGNAVQSARDSVADVVGCLPKEIYFVSGGTEGCNAALKGVCAARGKGKIVLSAIEHHALLESARDLEKFGFETVLINPDGRGIVDPESVAAAIDKDTIFVGVMAANNEIGTLQPVEEIGKICRERGVFYFCDCVQLAGADYLPTAHCDGLVVSSHKLYGPKGAGALYIKSGSKIFRLISGGMQERSLRGGTHNVAAIVGFAKAYTKAAGSFEENNKKIAALRDGFLSEVFAQIDGVHLNGDKNLRLAANANLSFDGCDGENLVFLLDTKGVCASTGAACAAGAVTPSHVLSALGLDSARVKSAVRFTFGKYNTESDVAAAAAALKEAVTSIKGLKG